MKLLLRWSSPPVFTLVALCFFLPFATVTSVSGCGEYSYADTHFTGMQLITRSVPPSTGADQPITKHEAQAEARDVERRGSGLAQIAFGAAIVGLLLALFGVAGGPGWCAAVGIGALLQLSMSALGSGDSGDGYDWQSHVGFWLALGSFAAAGLLHVVLLAYRRRTDTGQPVGYWIGVAGAMGVLFLSLFASPILTAILAVGVLVAAVAFFIRRMLARRRGERLPPTFLEHLAGVTLGICVALIAGFALHLLWLMPLIWALVLAFFRTRRAQSAAGGAAPEGTAPPAAQ